MTNSFSMCEKPMFDIKLYEKSDKDEWNRFVGTSKNGTFLLLRDYMDYHSDRFTDCSLLFYKNGKLHALLPANRKGDTLYSHQGLTYGGLIMNEHNTADETVTLFSEMNAFLKSLGIRHVTYKCIPHIYHRLPSEEDLYAIFRTCNARLADRNISSTICMNSQLKWSRDRKYGINRARNNQVEIEADSQEWAGFWQVLNYNLNHKYGAKPVHSLDEILLLKSRFPNNIRLYVAKKAGVVIGGTVLYLTPTVAHAQYISANDEGKHLRVIDAVYNKILHEDLTGFTYFDFGKSTEQDGFILNTSLIYQKEGFGGRGICYDWYEWDIE